MRREEQLQAVAEMPSFMAAAGAAAAPEIQQINVTNNSSMTIGPKFTSVTQNVHQEKVVKGRVLGLEVKTRGGTDTRRLHCGIAVFVCWAILVAVVLGTYVIYVTLVNHPERLDLDLSEPWYLRRAEWWALPAFDKQLLTLPARYALIGHSVTDACTGYYDCVQRIRQLQNNHQTLGRPDIDTNYLVGSVEGFIFEGRGANIVGDMVQGWNSQSQTIMFVGDYRIEHDHPHPVQMENLAKLLEALVKAGALDPDYVLLGQCQVIGRIVPPGVRVLRELQAFPHWDSRNITTCQQWIEFEAIINSTTTEVVNTEVAMNP